MPEKVRPAVVAFAVLVSCCLCIVNVARGEVTKKTFTIPDYGDLTLRLPENWDATLDKPKDGSPLRINVVDKDFKEFSMVVTPVNPPGDKEPATPERVRKMLDTVLLAMKAEATDSDLTVEELKGSQTIGYWFALTRQAKKAANLPHATHARIAVGERLILGVVIVQRHKNGPAQHTGLEIMKKATIAPAAAKAATTRPAGK